MAVLSSLATTPYGRLSTTSIFCCSVVIYISYSLVYSLYDVFLGPLSKFPGPKLRAFTKIPSILTQWKGDESTVLPALHAKYGPVVRIAPREISYAVGAEANRDINGHKQQIPKDMTEFYFIPLNGTPGIAEAGVEDHAQQRKIFTHSFSDKSLKDMEPRLKGNVQKLVGRLHEGAALKSSVDICKLYNCCTFDIMGDLAFNENLGMLDAGEYNHWVENVFAIVKSATRLRALNRTSALLRYILKNVLMNLGPFYRARLDHWSYTSDRIKRRVSTAPSQPDLWTKVLEKSTAEKDSIKITPSQHESNAAFFMMAGTETTATALCGITYHLARNPTSLARLTNEIRSAFPDYASISMEGLARLPYLRAVLHEGLRMYPPVPTKLPRRTPPGGVTIMGEYIPGDVVVGQHQLSVNRSEQNFKHPYEFRPERWMGDAEFRDDRLDAMEPFSSGPRACLGKNLAWHEMRLMLAAVVLEFDMSLAEKSLEWADQKVFVVWEKDPLMMNLKPVKNTVF